MSKNSSSTPTPAVPVVEAVAGGYRIRIGKQTHFVNKRRQCSCHAPNCPAIAAVTDYLRHNSQRALTQTPRTFACPICDAEASGSLERRRWACSADATHLYVWWAAQLQAKQTAFKQRWSPYTREVMEAFASDQTRAVFLEQHRLTYPAQT